MTQLSATNTLDQIGNHEISIKDHVQDIIKTIEEEERGIHAYITLIEEEALQEAKKMDQLRKHKKFDGKLLGLVVGVKDNICTHNIRTTCGSKILEDFTPPYNATVIERLEDEGAIVIGKTNMDEFAMGTSTETSFFGTTKNPYDHTRVPGGSSGGSAASVANGESDLALGSDTGGSVRCPASFCGIVGLKPTYGAVSRYGLISYANSLEQIGPMGRSVKDCKLLYDVISTHDPRDSTSISNNQVSKRKGKKKIKILTPKEFFNEGTVPQITKAVLDTLSRFETDQIETEMGSLTTLSYSLSAYYIIAMSEASSNLARYDGVRYGYRAPTEQNWEESFSKTRAEGFGMEVKRRIILGNYTLSAGYYNKYYMKAQKVRTLLRNEFNKAFTQFDFIVGPTMPILPFKIGEKMNDPMAMYMCDIDTVPANLTGIPALTLPCGCSGGLPIGIQIMGPPLSEEQLFQVGTLIERELQPLPNW